MKNIKFLFLLLLVFISSCTKDLTSLNNDIKNPAVVPSNTLFTNAQKNFVRTVVSTNVNLNIFRLIVQYWQETTYTAESRYNLNSRSIPQGLWTAMYRDVLQDLETSKTLMATDVADPAIQKNQLAQVDIMEVYTYYYLVTTFGNIPYTEALDIDNVFPKFDEQKEVFTDLLTRLDNDITALDPAAEGLGTADVIYNGDITSWKKFANSLKLKMGMTIADDDAAKSKSIVESAVEGGIFTSNADNAIFQFLAAPPNTNPIWEDLVQSGRQDFVAASTLIDTITQINDPRVPFYFTNDNAGSFSGGGPGRSSSYVTFSKPAAKIALPDFPGVLLDYSEVEFMLAEAVERGYNVGSTAADHYNKAITASIVYWGGTDTEAAQYLQQPSVAYTSSVNYKQKIGFQKWIALYNRAWDAWIEWRRLDYPQLEPAYRATSVIPLRFTYPVNEQNYNTENYNTAAKAIGGDVVSAKLFWDKF